LQNCRAQQNNPGGRDAIERSSFACGVAVFRSQAETIADTTNLHRKPLAAIQCRNAAHVESGRDRAARVAARLDATLDVRAQRLGSGECVSLVLLRLLGTAEYQRSPFLLMPRALAAASACLVQLLIYSRSCSAADSPPACRSRAASPGEMCDEVALPH
jgi:hypothetical protein